MIARTRRTHLQVALLCFVIASFAFRASARDIRKKSNEKCLVLRQDCLRNCSDKDPVDYCTSECNKKHHCKLGGNDERWQASNLDVKSDASFTPFTLQSVLSSSRWHAFFLQTSTKSVKRTPIATFTCAAVEVAFTDAFEDATRTPLSRSCSCIVVGERRRDLTYDECLSLLNKQEACFHCTTPSTA